MRDQFQNEIFKKVVLFDKGLNFGNFDEFLHNSGIILRPFWDPSGIILELSSDDLDLFFDHSSYFTLLKKYPNNKVVRDFVFDSLKKKLFP